MTMSSREHHGVPLFGRVVAPLQRFLAHEAAGGVLLFVTALAAMIIANSELAPLYDAFTHASLVVGVGREVVRFDLLTLVNDGLMTIFFFVVGLEVKRELVSGELRTFQRALLPAIAAFGGMLVPALVYGFLNAGSPAAGGWGIPVATDIAFVIGCLAILGTRVPPGVAVFVVALAIFDDIGGILVIALRYGSGLHVEALAAAAVITALLFACNRMRIAHWLVYATGGVALWVALHHGGIHATLAGVITGLTVPATHRRSPGEVLRDLRAYLLALPCDDESKLAGGELAHIEERIEDLEPPLERFVETLHPLQVYVIMPLFAFVNAGVSLEGFDAARLLAPVPLGIILGLFAGKQVGIFLAAAIAIKVRLAPMPTGGTWRALYGVAILAGIGFTVSLFIAGLAFTGEPETHAAAKVGILVGSILSGVVGFVVLRTLPRRSL